MQVRVRDGVSEWGQDGSFLGNFKPTAPETPTFHHFLFYLNPILNGTYFVIWGGKGVSTTPAGFFSNALYGYLNLYHYLAGNWCLISLFLVCVYVCRK